MHIAPKFFLAFIYNVYLKFPNSILLSFFSLKISKFNTKARLELELAHKDGVRRKNQILQVIL